MERNSRRIDCCRNSVGTIRNFSPFVARSLTTLKLNITDARIGAAFERLRGICSAISAVAIILAPRQTDIVGYVSAHHPIRVASG